MNTNVTNTNHKSTTTTQTTTTAENDKEVVHNYQPNINESPNVNNSVATKIKVDTAALSPSQLHTIPEDGSSNQEQKESIQPVQNKGRVFTLFDLSK